MAWNPDWSIYRAYGVIKMGMDPDEDEDAIVKATKGKFVLPVRNSCHSYPIRSFHPAPTLPQLSLPARSTSSASSASSICSCSALSECSICGVDDKTSKSMEEPAAVSGDILLTDEHPDYECKGKDDDDVMKGEDGNKENVSPGIETEHTLEEKLGFLFGRVYSLHGPGPGRVASSSRPKSMDY